MSDEPRIVLFDLDLTLVAMNTFWAFGRALLRDGVLPAKALARAGLESLLYETRLRSLDAAMASTYALLAGLDVRMLESRADAFVQREVAPRVFADAKARIDAHHDRGDRVVITSSGPAFLVERVAAHVGALEALATRCQIRGGCLGQVLLPGAWGEGKVKLARRAGFLDGKAHVYTDHEGDLELVRASAFATLVNPTPALTWGTRRAAVEHETVRWSKLVDR